MKKIILVSFSFFMLTGCFEKDPQPRGTVTALLNGKTWRAERIYTSYSRYSEDHAGFSADKGKLSLLEHLSFTAFPLEPGKFDIYKIGTVRESIPNKQSASFSVHEYDMPLNLFEVLETPRSGAENTLRPEDRNHFTITSIKGNEIQGTFQVVLVREKRPDNLAYEALPDTLRFTEGRFRVYLED